MTDTEPKTTARTTGELIPQAHGGALRNGGPNSGGRPKSAIRKKAGETFEELLDAIKLDLKAGKLSASERIKAADLMGKYGMGELKEMSVDKDTYLECMSDVLAEYLEPDLALQVYDSVVTRLKDTA